MKNILFISPTGGYAGIDVCLETLVLNLEREKYTPIVVFPQGAYLKPKFESQGIRCYSLDLFWWFPIEFHGDLFIQQMINSRNNINALVQIIKNNNIDIVFSNTSVNLDGHFSSAICKVPHITFLHAQFVENIYVNMSKETKEFIYRLMGSISYKLVCCSQFLCDFMSNYAQNTTTIFNGVDTSKFVFNKRVLHDNDRLSIVCIGHYNENKQQDFVLHALNILKEQNSELAKRVKYTMVGPGEPEYIKKLKALSKEFAIEEMVDFFEFRSDISEYINNFNLYINSSKTENLPVSVLEAMASGLPVIGTPNDGNLQLIDEGKTGFICTSPDIMAERITYLLKNPTIIEAMSINARNRVLDNFTQDIYVENFESLFDEINGIHLTNKNAVSVLSNFYQMLIGKNTIKSHLKNILVIYPEEAKASYYIAAKILLDYLQKENLIQYKAVTRSEITESDIIEANIIYCIRFYDDYIYEIMKRVQSMNKLFVWFIDDNYSALRMENDEVIHEEHVNIEYERMYEHSNAVVVLSDELLRFGMKLTKKIYCIPTYQLLDFQCEKQNTDPNRSVKFGFMGTLKRDGDFSFVVPALKKLLEEYEGEIEIEFIGYYPNELKGHPSVRIFDFVPDYFEFRKFFYSLQWDFAIAPLNDTKFNRSKTNNKYREYSSLCVPGIYSDISTYNVCVKNEITGILCSNTSDAWYMNIKRLINNPSLRKELAANAFDDIKRNYTVTEAAKALLYVFNEISTPFFAPIGLTNTVTSEIESSPLDVVKKIFLPSELSFSGKISKMRKYDMFCEINKINEIILIFKKISDIEALIRIKITMKGFILREIIVNSSEINNDTWTRLKFSPIIGVAGEILTICVEVESDNLTDCCIGLYEISKNRKFLYKVMNKLGYPIKGRGTLAADFV